MIKICIFHILLYQMAVHILDVDLEKGKDSKRMDFNDKKLINLPITSIPNYVTTLQITANQIVEIPDEIAQLSQLRSLDVSYNRIEKISENIGVLTKLEIFIAKNNKIVDLPENLSNLKDLRIFNLAGNKLDHIPLQLFDLQLLKQLHLGGNLIDAIPKEIKHLQCLEFLYLGGNQIESVPSEVGQLHHLLSLNLSSNKIAFLPRDLDQLKRLESLHLHRNLLHFLPKSIINLENLLELSLRNNPLVHKFTLGFNRTVPSLVEICSCAIKVQRIPYKEILPTYLTYYLDRSQECDNPNCDGVYFDTKVEKLKFVDFCGRYRVPLLEYICTHCDYGTMDGVSSSSSEEDEPTKQSMRRIIMEN